MEKRPAKEDGTGLQRSESHALPPAPTVTNTVGTGGESRSVQPKASPPPKARTAVVPRVNKTAVVPRVNKTGTAVS